MHIWEMGLSKEVGSLLFCVDTGNPGAGRFITAEAELRIKTGLVKIPVATLDNFARERGWFISKPNIEILKVDVERHEAEVFLGGKELLRSGMMVQNIITEVGRDVDPALQVQALNLLIESGYRLAGKGGFRFEGHINLASGRTRR
jgi:FkbM family methyltransferase